MLPLLRTVRRALPLVAGIIVGLPVAWWTTVEAAALLPNLQLIGVTSGQVVSGVVPLSASASAAGFVGVQFGVSGQNIGTEITAGSCVTSWDTRTVADGSHTVTAIARDSVGNTVSATPVVVNVQNATTDTVAPTVAVIAPTVSATVTGTIMATASATDNVGVAGVWFTLDGANLGAEIAAAPYQVSWTSTGTSNGSHVLRALARDAAGNVATSSPVTVTVSNAVTDTTPPVVSLTAPAAGGTVTGIVTVSANATDNVGMASVQFTLDGANLGAADTSSPYAMSWNTTGLTNGSHVLAAVARDVSGNVATSTPVTVTVSNVTPDTTPPTANISAPVAGATVSGTVSVTATATDNVGVASVQFTLDGANLGTLDTTAPYAVTWSTTSATNGQHTLRAIVRDAAGNQGGADSVVVTVNNATPDTTAPVVNLTAPAAGATVSGTVTVSATASDNIGVASVQFTLDGVALGAPDTASPYQITWGTTGTNSGTHTLGAIAKDAAGNSATAPTLTVTVNNVQPDTTAPNVSITSPAAGAMVSGTVTLSATATDNVGVAGVQFQVNGANVGVEATTAPYTLSWQSTSVPNGNYQVTAIARDASGNSRTSVAITITVSNQTSLGVIGDFDGDGLPDLIFEHTSGLLYTWSMNGSNMIGGDYLTPDNVPAPWQVVAIDDFNADGKSDLLIQNMQTGQLDLWRMNGRTRIDETAILSTNTPWRVRTTGDFDGDGKPDIIWQQPATGEIYVWLMDGAVRVGGGPLTPSQVPPSWRIVGAADMNHDGKVDLVWQDASGSLAVWFMNGLTATSTASLTPGVVNPAWQIKAVADFDRDGNADLVWQNTATGYLYIWYLNGTVLARDGFLTPARVSTAWQLVGDK